MKHSLFFALAAATSLAACQQEPDVVEQYDPMAEDLANAEQVDASDVPMMLSSHSYRCSGSNAVVQVDFIRTGEEMSARVTPQGGEGMSLPETAPGTYGDGSTTLSGEPDADSVTYNGTTCNR